MPVILLRVKKNDNQTVTRPQACPYCGSTTLQRWGRVAKTIKDRGEATAVLYRYRCNDCGRTFRDYPQGIGRSDYTTGVRKLAALIWALGLSYRDIVKIFEDLGIQLSRSTIWREGQELVTKLEGRRLQNHVQRFKIDKNYIHRISPTFGIVVAVDFGVKKYTILGTLNEHNPKTVLDWLQPLVDDASIQIMQLGTGKLDLFHSKEHIDTGELLS